MLRVHFTAGDVARTRVADGPDALWETVLSLHRLQEKRAEPRLAEWRRHVLLHGGPVLRLLLPLAPARGYFPDFLTPPESSAGFGDGLDSLLSTPRSRLREEVGRLAVTAPDSAGAWVRAVGEGRAAALRELGDALRGYWGTAFAGSSWGRVRAAVESDRSLRARVQWRRGTEAMLRTFHPCMRWRPPVLECDYPVVRDMRLDGRGLLLIPSYFCRRTPVALADPSLPPTLVYPARVTGVPTYEPWPVGTGGPNGTVAAGGSGIPGGAVGGPHDPDPARARLARLLGHTRAAVLQSVGGDCTTTELARRAGVSVSSASEHAAVLRGAGLISSGRERNTVRHTLTPVGLALLDGRSFDVPPALPPPLAPALSPAAGGSEYALP